MGSLNGCLCAAGLMGDGMGSGGVMAGWVGLRSISKGLLIVNHDNSKVYASHHMSGE
jgi:hypothetical protein